jgi:cytoskeletal protein RodZ
VSVGEALAKARSRAGLSVDELSERTRIRKTVIRCIEQDDWDACGGDLFVRGYVRAIAGAVGIDARPLISEYNRTRTDSSRDRDTHITHVARIADQVSPAADAADSVSSAADPAATAADPSFPAPSSPAPSSPAADAAAAAAGRQPLASDPDATRADLPVVDAGLGAAAVDRPLAHVPPVDRDATRADLPFVSEDPTPTVSDLPVIPAEPAPPPMPWEPPRPTGAQLPGTWAAEPSGTPSRPRRPERSERSRRPHRSERPRGRSRARIAVPAALVLAVAGVAIGLVASSSSAPSGQNAALTQRPSHAAGGPLGTGKTANKPTTPASSATSPSPATSPTSTPTASAPTAAAAPVTSLHIAGAEAFGPQGLADGDNTQNAASVIGGGSQSPWSSQWYATAQFGNLKQGTGLLIDMGHPVTITSVRINLASYGGANLQLRVGDPAGGPSGMKVAARANNVGGTVRLQLQSPQYVRYLLIWFTLLPPNGAGQYQATVYHVVVNGRS